METELQNAQSRVIPREFKLQSAGLVAQNTAGTRQRLWRVYCKNAKMHFLIDTGAELSVVPVRRFPNLKKNQQGCLKAANGSPIGTYGEVSMTVSLNCRRNFQWIFTVAEVQEPIIGADFIHIFQLLVDLKNQVLIDGLTNIK